MRDYNDSQPIFNPMSPGIIGNNRRIGITINKTRNLCMRKTSGFPGKFNTFTYVVYTRFNNYTRLQKSTSILRISTLFLIYNTHFRKYRIFWVFKLHKNHYFSNMTYELTNISYVDVFPKYLYSQVTGKSKNMYPVMSWCFV